MLKHITEVMENTCESYKERYKSLYKQFVSTCLLYNEGKATIGAKERDRGSLNEACYVLIDIFSLSDKDVMSLEREVEMQNGWSESDNFDRNVFN